MQIDNALLKYIQTMGSLYETAKRTENQALSYCREHRTQNTEHRTQNTEHRTQNQNTIRTKTKTKDSITYYKKNGQHSKMIDN